MSNKPKISKEYIEDSWNKMSLVLDHEMPTNKRRRRWLVLLLFAVGLALIAILYAIYFGTNKQTENFANNTSVSNEMSKNNMETKTIPLYDNSESENINVKKKINVAENIILNENSDNQFHKNNNDFTLDNNALSLSKGNTIKKSNDKITLESSSNQKILSNIKLGLVETILRVEPRNLLQYHQLPVLTYPLLKTQNRNVNQYLSINTTPPHTNVLNHNKWSVDLVSHGIIIPKENYTGVGLALNLNRQINSSFGISFGSGVSRWSRQVGFSDLQFEDGFESAIIEGNELDFSNSSFELLSKAWNLELSLGLFYDINSKIMLKGGSRYRYQFSRSYNTVFNAQNSMLGMPEERIFLDGNKNFMLPYIGIEIKFYTQFSLGFELEKSFSKSNQKVIKNNSQLYLAKVSYRL